MQYNILHPWNKALSTSHGNLCFQLLDVVHKLQGCGSSVVLIHEGIPTSRSSALSSPLHTFATLLYDPGLRSEFSYYLQKDQPVPRGIMVRCPWQCLRYDAPSRVKTRGASFSSFHYSAPERVEDPSRPLHSYSESTSRSWPAAERIWTAFGFPMPVSSQSQ